MLFRWRGYYIVIIFVSLKATFVQFLIETVGIKLKQSYGMKWGSAGEDGVFQRDYKLILDKKL